MIGFPCTVRVTTQWWTASSSGLLQRGVHKRYHSLYYVTYTICELMTSLSGIYQLEPCKRKIVDIVLGKHWTMLNAYRPTLHADDQPAINLFNCEVLEFKVAFVSVHPGLITSWSRKSFCILAEMFYWGLHILLGSEKS